MTFFIACDFDGTITLRDTLELVVSRFAPGVWDTIEVDLLAGEITLTEAMRREFDQVRVREADVVAHVLREAHLRPGFVEFVAWAEAEGHPLLIVSSGFRSLIDPVLARAGLSRLHVHAGEALFTVEGTSVMFPPSRMPCIETCGHCKSETIAAHEPFPGPLVYIGDGYSDRCAAQKADVVFAREELGRYLDLQGVASRPFEDFYEIRDVLKEL